MWTNSPQNESWTRIQRFWFSNSFFVRVQVNGKAQMHTSLRFRLLTGMELLDPVLSLLEPTCKLTLLNPCVHSLTGPVYFEPDETVERRENVFLSLLKAHSASPFYLRWIWCGRSNQHVCLLEIRVWGPMQLWIWLLVPVPPVIRLDELIWEWSQYFYQL